MTNQFVVSEIQGASITPVVFDVSEYPDEKAAKRAAKARYHQIMSAAYTSGVPYHGGNIIHMKGYDQMMIDGEIVRKGQELSELSELSE